MSELFEEENKESALTVTVQTENNENDYSEYYDEDYDESYDDEILEEVENENSGIKEETESEEKDEVIEEVKNRYDPKKQDTLYLKIFEKYFEKEIIRNPYFEKKYKKEFLPNCFQWVKSKVQKMARNQVAMVQSGKVFAMAISYFDDEIYIKEQKEKEEKERKVKEIEEKKKESELKKKQKEEHDKEYKEWLKKPMSKTTLSEEERQSWLNATQGELDLF